MTMIVSSSVVCNEVIVTTMTIVNLIHFKQQAETEKKERERERSVLKYLTSRAANDSSTNKFLFIRFVWV
jgi:hypothetical protein